MDKRGKLRRTIIAALLIFMFLFPILILMNTSLQAYEDIRLWPPKWFSPPLQWSNYYEVVFGEKSIMPAFINSLQVSLATMVVCVLIGSLAAYAVTRFDFKGREHFLFIIMISQMFSTVILVNPMYVTFRDLGILDTKLSLVLANTAVSLPMTVWLLYSYFSQIPIDYEESSWMDGSTRLQGIINIILPVSLPGLITAGLFAFLTSWGDLLFARSFILSPELRTISQALAGFQDFAGTLVTSFIAALWVAKRMRSFGDTTMPEYINRRFGRNHSLVACLIILVGAVTLLSAQITAAVVVIQALVNWSPLVISILVLVIFVIFTAMGGMKAVAWTDTICSYTIIIGVWIMAISFLRELGGFGPMMAGLKAIDPGYVSAFSEAITPVTALGWTVTWGICNFGALQFIGRFLSATTPEDAAKSQAITAMMLGFFIIPLLVIGLGGRLILPGIESQDLVFNTLVTKTINPYLGGLMFAAVIAAIISTADSLLLLASTTFTRDILKEFIKPNMTSKEELNISRVSTVVIGILAVGLTFIQSDVIQFIHARAVTLMGSAMAMLVLIGAFNKKVTSAGAMASMIVGFLVANIWYFLGQPYGVYSALPGTISSGLTLILVSKFTKPMAKEKLAEFFPEVLDSKQE